MTTGKNTITIGIRDLKISKLLLDDSTGVTYDTPLDVPGVKSIEIKIIQDEKELTGDGVILDNYVKRKGFDVTFKNAKFSQAVMDIINGTTTAVSGTTGERVFKTEDSADNTSAYFALEFAVEKAEGENDYHRILYKVSGNYEEEYTEDDYTICSFSGKGVARNYDNKFGCRTLYETKTEIAQIPAITTVSSNT